jgi:hypothetical protein
MKKFTQQSTKGLERYVHAECDLTVSGNVHPGILVEDVIMQHHSDITPQFLFEKIASDHFNLRSADPIILKDIALIKTQLHINRVSNLNIANDPLYEEYSKFSKNFNLDCEPVILLHPSIYGSQIKPTEQLYQFDGMHRVISALEARVKSLPAYVMIRRTDLFKLMNISSRRNIELSRNKCTWFPSYQEIKEVGISGQRVQSPRYTSIYDFSMLRDKTVVDFGGNTGQSAVEAYFHGVKKFYNLDIQECALEASQIIFKSLGMDNCSSHYIDFNKFSFEEDTHNICPAWDWCIFQAIYRTKEIIDIKKNFDYIVDHTKEGIVFEGNGDLDIDTDDFYYPIFDRYNFKNITSHGRCQQRPVYILYK